MKDTGGAAFPSLHYSDGIDENDIASFEGMTLRNYFAGQAMIAIIGLHRDFLDPKTGKIMKFNSKNCAEVSHNYADAMIQEGGK